jgi:3-phenylpropionate/trans-cinnamate dioxygenase ferredoxin reductase component
MPDFKYLIVGGGMTADAAVKGIREVDPSGAIALMGEEADPPYSRPPLSKALWKGKPVDRIWRYTEKHGVNLLLGRRAARLDLRRQTVVDDRGEAYGFDRLLLATGGRPRRLPFGGDNIIYYRTLADFRRLWSAAAHGQHFAVIGGGFIGAELAAALALNGKQVTLIFPDATLGSRVFPADLGNFLVDYYREKGVTVEPHTRVTDVVRVGDGLQVQTSGGALRVDGVVAGIGLQPNVELAQAAGLAVDDGMVVDEFLRTTHANVYAAGDAASFYYPALSQRLRFEHEDSALAMGRQAGRNLAGANTAYTHLPFFYSDLFDLGYEAVGDVDARLETLADWKDPYREGVIYYHANGHVRGVLLWNVWERVEAARRLITAGLPAAAGALQQAAAVAA